MRRKNRNRKHLELGGLKYDSDPKNTYYTLAIISLLGVVLYLPFYVLFLIKYPIMIAGLAFLVIPPCLFWALGWTKSIHRFCIYSEGINIMAVRFWGKPQEHEKWGFITGRRSIRYESIEAIYPLKLPLGPYRGLIIVLPSNKKKKSGGRICLREEQANKVIEIVKEQMGGLWNEKYKGKNPDRVT